MSTGLFYRPRSSAAHRRTVTADTREAPQRPLALLPGGEVAEAGADPGVVGVDFERGFVVASGTVEVVAPLVDLAKEAVGQNI